MTHIMWLVNLAPNIQEAILFLPRAESGPDKGKEIDVRRIARVMDWGLQREEVVSLDSAVAFSWHTLFSILNGIAEATFPRSE